MARNIYKSKSDEKWAVRFWWCILGLSALIGLFYWIFN